MVVYGTGFEDVAADVAAFLAFRAQALKPAAGSGGAALPGHDFASGVTYGARARSLPEDIVNQTAGDKVPVRRIPSLIVQLTGRAATERWRRPRGPLPAFYAARPAASGYQILTRASCASHMASSSVTPKA